MQIAFVFPSFIAKQLSVTYYSLLKLCAVKLRRTYIPCYGQKFPNSKKKKKTFYNRFHNFDSSIDPRFLVKTSLFFFQTKEVLL